MWPLNNSNIASTYETNNFYVPDEYTLTSQWELDNGYSENEIDLATVMMNLKEDYPEHYDYDGCNDDDHHDQMYYQTMDSVDQQLQWHSTTESAAEPPPPPAQRVLVYDTLQDGNYIGSTDDNYLLPTILDVDEGCCKTSGSPIEKKRAGRPRGTKVKRSKAEPKLSRIWEFIRDLLLDAQYCPTYICWENYEEGRFRFVQSDKVAKLWGKFKRNERMNYEKFSRAMRYYYKTGVLLPVQGKRLVYKFGPKATGWQTNNPNFKYTF